MKLVAKGRYHSAFYHVDGPGVVDVDETLGQRLLADAPENFSVEVARKTEPVIVETKAIEVPVADKMIKAPSRKKGA